MLSKIEISTAYEILLGRAPDDAGLAHYMAAQTLGLDDLRASLVASEDFKQREAARLAETLYPHILQRLQLERPWRSTMFIPSPEVYASTADAPFMPYSTCSGADFLHPSFAAILAELGLRNQMHRKLWEWYLLSTTCARLASSGPAGGV